MVTAINAAAEMVATVATKAMTTNKAGATTVSAAAAINVVAATICGG